MLLCLTVIDLSFEVFGYKKKVQKRQRKDIGREEHKKHEHVLLES